MQAIPPHPGLPSECRGGPKRAYQTQEARGAGGKGRRRRHTTKTSGLAWRAGSAHTAGTACKGRVGVQVDWRGATGVTGRARGARAGAAGGVGERGGAGYRVVHPPHQDAEDRLAGPE